MINNRQAGRRRGRGSGGGNNGQRQGNPGRDSGNRIDSRARGNASQLLEKYKNLASDAQRQGDRVNTEYYLQFADHYFRVLSEQRGRFEDQQPARRNRDDFDFDGDTESGGDFGGGEFGDEGAPVRAGEQGHEQPRGDREDRPREFRREGNEQRLAREPREWQDRGERRPREDRPREDRPREDRPREDRQRDDRPRADQPRGDRQRPERPVEVAGQRRAEPLSPNESLEGRAEEVLEADRPLDAPAPRRRGRPRREEIGESAPVALDADRLPPAISLAPAVAANDEAPAEAKPRRRRARPAEDTPDAAE